MIVKTGMKVWLFGLLFSVCSQVAVAQTDSVVAVSAVTGAYKADSVVAPCVARERDGQPRRGADYRFRLRQIAVPAVLIGAGSIGAANGWMRHQNSEIRDELQEEVDVPLTVDDFMQYAPMAAVYGFDLFGVKARHGFWDRTVIMGTSYVIMAAVVNTLKHTTKVMRPDGSTANSFPSGHTATAFLGAEMLRQEYGSEAPWIAVTGYAAATAVGFFRMYNNRHWFTDVLAGAGIGMLSAKAGYWLYPLVTKTLVPKRFRSNVALSPFVSDEGRGITGAVVF